MFDDDQKTIAKWGAGIVLVNLLFGALFIAGVAYAVVWVVHQIRAGG